MRSGRLWTAVSQQQHRCVLSHPVVPCASILLQLGKRRCHCMLSKQNVLHASLSLTPFSSRRVYLLSPQRCQCNLLANNSTQSISIDPMISSMPQNCHKLLNAESYQVAILCNHAAQRSFPITQTARAPGAVTRCQLRRRRGRGRAELRSAGSACLLASDLRLCGDAGKRCSYYRGTYR